MACFLTKDLHEGASINQQIKQDFQQWFIDFTGQANILAGIFGGSEEKTRNN